MVAAPVGEATAHGQPGVAGTDDEGVDVSHAWLRPGCPCRRPEGLVRDRRPGRAPSQAVTSMLTGTPLVMTSYTAERSRDCSTTLRSFSGSSPSRWKLTRICW